MINKLFNYSYYNDIKSGSIHREYIEGDLKINTEIVGDKLYSSTKKGIGKCNINYPDGVINIRKIGIDKDIVRYNHGDHFIIKADDESVVLQMDCLPGSVVVFNESRKRYEVYSDIDNMHFMNAYYLTKDEGEDVLVSLNKDYTGSVYYINSGEEIEFKFCNAYDYLYISYNIVEFDGCRFKYDKYGTLYWDDNQLEIIRYVDYDKKMGNYTVTSGFIVPMIELSDGIMINYKNGYQSSRIIIKEVAEISDGNLISYERSGYISDDKIPEHTSPTLFPDIFDILN